MVVDFKERFMAQFEYMTKLELKNLFLFMISLLVASANLSSKFIYLYNFVLGVL